MEEENKKSNNRTLESMLLKVKNLKKDQLLILLLVGILLVIIAIPTKKDSSNTEDTDLFATTNADSTGSTQEEELEIRLKNVLKQVKGVGEVDVMVTIKSKGEKIVEKDVPRTENTTSETDSQGGTRNTKEITSDEVTVYTQDSGGNQVPYVVEEVEPSIKGVIVIAQGGDDPLVVKEISEAVMALFQVEAHRIKIMKMNEIQK